VPPGGGHQRAVEALIVERLTREKSAKTARTARLVRKTAASLPTLPFLSWTRPSMLAGSRVQCRQDEVAASFENQEPRWRHDAAEQQGVSR